MENGYRHIRRIGSTGLALTAAAWLVFPDSATAREPAPVVAGSCTVAPSKEKGGPAPRSETPDRDTESDDQPTDSGKAPDDGGLSVSLSGGVHLDESKALTGLLTRLCETGKEAINGLFGPVLDENETTPPNSGDTPPDEFEDNVPPTGETTPDSPPVSETTTSERPTEAAPESEPAGSPPGIGAVGGGWGGVSAERSTSAVDVPPTRSDTGSVFSATPHDSRATHDVKAAERLPVLLAVLSVVLVGAALAHTWARRTLLR